MGQHAASPSPQGPKSIMPPASALNKATQRAQRSSGGGGGLGVHAFKRRQRQAHRWARGSCTNHMTHGIPAMTVSMATCKRRRPPGPRLVLLVPLRYFHHLCVGHAGLEEHYHNGPLSRLRYLTGVTSRDLRGQKWLGSVHAVLPTCTRGEMG